MYNAREGDGGIYPAGDGDGGILPQTASSLAGDQALDRGALWLEAGSNSMPVEVWTILDCSRRPLRPTDRH